MEYKSILYLGRTAEAYLSNITTRLYKPMYLYIYRYICDAESLFYRHCMKTWNKYVTFFDGAYSTSRGGRWYYDVIPLRHTCLGPTFKHTRSLLFLLWKRDAALHWVAASRSHDGVSPASRGYKRTSLILTTRLNINSSMSRNIKSSNSGLYYLFVYFFMYKNWLLSKYNIELYYYNIVNKY